jgi:aminoglycoside 3-N-acetyltransferase
MALVTEITKELLPSRMLAFLLRMRRKAAKRRIASRPVLSEDAIRTILTRDLEVRDGDTVLVHSSLDELNLGFPYGRLLGILQQLVGARGTLMFPTYPRRRSYEFLASGEIFDVRKTPSYTGMLTELARRHPKALRSLHPTKSVCAIGLHANELVSTHQDSVYPFDSCSPYSKLMEYGGKTIGIGVSTMKLSFAHCVEDALKEQFPIRVYHRQLFSARCIDYGGEERIVRTYAHDMRQMNLRTKHFVAKYIDQDICKDFTVEGREFFRCDATRLFHAMTHLAKRGIIIYSRVSFYPNLLLAEHSPA